MTCRNGQAQMDTNPANKISCIRPPTPDEFVLVLVLTLEVGVRSCEAVGRTLHFAMFPLRLPLLKLGSELRLT